MDNHVCMRITSSGVLNAGVPGTDRAVCTFPSLTALADGTLLATYRTGSTKDCGDETVELRRSADGEHWSEPERPFRCDWNGRGGSLRVVYVTPFEDRRLVACGLWIDREAFPGQPLFNPETEGCLPMAIVLAESGNLGRTWSALRGVATPAELGPPSLTNPLLRLPDGRVAISIETNKPYGDPGPWRQRVVYMYSENSCVSWKAPQTVCEDPTGRVFNWDQRAGVAPDGRLATFSWVYDRQQAKYEAIRRRISSDSGRTWDAGEDLGFADQPSHPAMLADGRVVLAWVDRYGTRSIRARAAGRVDAPFTAETEVVIHQAALPAATVSSTAEMLADQSSWSYGLPYAEALDDGTVMVVYYAGSPAAMSICWARLAP